MPEVLQTRDAPKPSPTGCAHEPDQVVSFMGKPEIWNHLCICGEKWCSLFEYGNPSLNNDNLKAIADHISAAADCDHPANQVTWEKVIEDGYDDQYDCRCHACHANWTSNVQPGQPAPEVEGIKAMVEGWKHE